MNFNANESPDRVTKDANLVQCSLSRLGIGRCGYVVAIEPHADRDLKRRLLEMGFCNGVSVECIRRAPLGDPIEFKLRGYNLSLRGDQARFVKIVTTR